MNASLPQTFQDKLAALARRIRWAQVARGVSWLILGLLAGQLVLFAVDAVVGFEPRGLRGSLLVMIAVGVAVCLTRLLLPLCRPLRATTLAALVEQRHPELQEKLLSAVDFTQQRGTGHGSAVFIAQVIDQAGQACQPLDFQAAFSPRSSRRWLQFALLALFASLVSSFLFPAYGAFQHDLWLAWSLPANPFILEVTPGTSVVAKDRPVKIVVKAVASWQRAFLPHTCSLVLHDFYDQERLPMTVDGDGFAFVLDRINDVQTYHVEAGSFVSETFRLTGVEPIRLAQGSPGVNVTPPPYVNPLFHPKLKLPEPSSFLALQYSTMRIEFQVNRTPRTAHVTLSEDQGSATDLPVTWRENGRDGFADIVAGKSGKFAGKLIMIDEHGLAFELPLPSWQVWPDEPPIVMELPFRGKSSTAFKVAPDEILPLKIAVEDMVGLERVELEYRVNADTVVSVLLVSGEGKPRLTQEVSFALAGKVKEGDDFFWRLKVTDNRRLAREQIASQLPPRELPPQFVYEPSARDGQERWHLLKVASQADPLMEQQVLAQRDEVRKQIDALKLQIEQERAQLNKVKVGLHQQAFLNPAQVQQIEQVRDKNRANQNALRKFGWELGVDPFLQLLAPRPLALAAGELTRSDTQLSQSTDKAIFADAREQKLGKADDELVQALKGLEAMREANERLALDRLDMAKMELLARKQAELAQRAAELAARDIGNDPKAKEELARIQQEQARLAAELERLAQQSKLFQESLQRARIQQAQQLAKQAEKMAQAQRDLFQASQKALAAELQKRLAELAQRQQALAGSAAELGKEAKLPPPEMPPGFEEAKNAAQALRDGAVENALRDQAKTMTDLARLGEAIGQSLPLGRDPREGAHNMQRLQVRLEKELLQLAEDLPRLPAEQVRQRLLALYQAQKLLQENLGRLQIPADLKEALVQRAQAQDLVGQVAEAFRRDGLAAQDKMKEAHVALKRLAELLPANLDAADPKATPIETLARLNAERAAILGKEQKTLRDEVLKLLGQAGSDPSGQGNSPLHAMKEKQDDLKKETDQLGKDLMKLSQKDGSPEAKMAGEEAGRAAEDASKAMTQSKEKSAEGKMTEAEKLAEEAALKLELAGKRAAEAAKEMQAKLSPQPDADKADPTAQALNQAQNQMNQAQSQLQKGQPRAAQPAMRQSAKALQQAAQKASEQIRQATSGSAANNPPNGQPAPPEPPSGSPLAQELLKYGAVSWGDMPGELRSRIVQDMRARYGDDYARIIQGYFQGLAEEPVRNQR